MSFGFSIGDVVLLSQLAYNLYTSISSGRRAASRDLKELEDVLFSLKCSLDHLGEVARDVLTRANGQQVGPDFKKKLDQMISSCGSTLQELDIVTKKYREMGIDVEEQTGGTQTKPKRRTIDDITRSIKVNWRKVRWDQEKQSLQQYREKLKSHTDAINLILTATIWANTANAASNSTSNHDKTHSLLGEVLNNPQTDPTLRNMIQEIHTTLTKRSVTGNKVVSPDMKVYGRPYQTKLPPNALQLRSASLMAIPSNSAMGALDSTQAASIEPNMWSASFAQPTTDTMGVRFRSLQTPHAQDDSIAFAHFGSVASPPSNFAHRVELAPATVNLNKARRAFGVKESEAFRKRHNVHVPPPPPPKPAKPAFLTSSDPACQQLHQGIAYLFHSVPDGKLETQTRRQDIQRWVHGFASLVNSGGMAKSGSASEPLVPLLSALNEAVDPDRSDKTMRRLFYDAAESAGFMAALDQLQSTSKSVRVMKELEEYQDNRDEWDG